MERIVLKVGLDYLLNTLDSGIWVFGDPVLDYVIKDLQTNQIGASILPTNGGKIEGIRFPNKRGIRIVDNNKEIAIVNFPLMPDGKGAKPTLDVYAGNKYAKAAFPNAQITDYIDILLQNVIVDIGGGEPNLARPLIEHSPEIKVAVTGLRPEINSGPLFKATQTIDMLVRNADKEAGNIAIVGINGQKIDKIIGRGDNLYGRGIIPFNQKPDFDIGTFVLDSSQSEYIVNEFLKQYQTAYNAAINNGKRIPLAVICLTSKMSPFYDRTDLSLCWGAVKKGALTIYNATEAVKYGLRHKLDDEAHKKKEKDLTYEDIIRAMKLIREEQYNRPQRIYVTLGEAGCLGMDENGYIYRTNKFDVGQGENNGGGDRAASMITRMEHLRATGGPTYPILEIMAAASATAASFIKTKDVSKNAIRDVMLSQSLGWELIGNIDDIRLGDSIYTKKLSNKPITGKYNLMKFVG